MKKRLKRSKTAHKGDYGRVFVLAGSKGFTGAAYLSSFAAVRSGAGLVTLGCPEAVYSVLARRAAEVMVCGFPSTSTGSLAYRAYPKIFKFSKSQDVLALGPGLSQHQETQKLVRRLIQNVEKPAVIDADAINALKGFCGILSKRKAATVLTPHPGEFCRTFGLNPKASQKDRLAKAKTIAKRFAVILVLKGHQTIVATPTGKTFVNKTGNPGMATGGTGDVLTGIIAALIGQGLSPWQSTCMGVHVHGLAGDYAAKAFGEISLAAGDLVSFLPKAFQRI